MVQEIAVDAHVAQELGHVSTLPGAHHFRGSMINTRDRQAHFVTSAHRLPGARVLICAREPRADPSAVVPESELRTVTVSWT